MRHVCLRLVNKTFDLRKPCAVAKALEAVAAELKSKMRAGTTIQLPASSACMSTLLQLSLHDGHQLCAATSTTSCLISSTHVPYIFCACALKS